MTQANSAATLKEFFPELVNKTVTIGGQCVTLIGYNARNTKYCFIGRTDSGVCHNFSDIEVMTSLAN